MNAPRPGDAYYLDVTYRDGHQIRFAMDAMTAERAFYEAAFILGGCGDRFVPAHRRDPHGELRDARGRFVAEGDTRHFEELS